MLVLQSVCMYYEYGIRNSHGNSYSASSPNHSYSTYAHTYTYIRTHTHACTHAPHPPPPPPPPPVFGIWRDLFALLMIFNAILKINDINKLRYLHFLKLCENNLRRLPPTRDALRQHIFRAAYAAGWIWEKPLKHDIQVPSPTEWGWRLNNDRQLVPTWCPSVLVELKDFVFTCCCKGTCTRCKCMIKGTSCLPFCNCNYKKGK